jgi:hypothetical protein
MAPAVTRTGKATILVLYRRNGRGAGHWAPSDRQTILNAWKYYRLDERTTFYQVYIAPPQLMARLHDLPGVEQLDELNRELDYAEQGWM